MTKTKIVAHNKPKRKLAICRHTFIVPEGYGFRCVDCHDYLTKEDLFRKLNKKEVS
jgi:hypothetical protein